MDVENLVAHGEAVESGLDLLIEKRHDKRVREEGHRPSEEMYMQSVRRYEDRQHREKLWAKLRFHEAMLRSHSETYEHLIRRHRSELVRVEEMLGLSEKRDAA